MYSKESIKKFMEQANEKIATTMERDPSDLHVVISKGNKKIGHTMNVSLLPIFTCANCKECKSFCYDIKACLQYPKNVLSARVNNTVLVRKNMEQYFEQIEKAIQKRRKNFYFRWHVAGDILSAEYFDNMVRIAKKYPHFRFWTYTKNYSLVNEYVKAHGNSRKKAIPSNLSVMFSEWKGLTMDNPYNFPVFACVFPNEKPQKQWYKCTGNCNDCIANKTGCIYGKTSYVGLH